MCKATALCPTSKHQSPYGCRLSTTYLYPGICHLDLIQIVGHFRGIYTAPWNSHQKTSADLLFTVNRSSSQPKSTPNRISQGRVSPWTAVPLDLFMCTKGNARRDSCSLFPWTLLVNARADGQQRYVDSQPIVH